MLTVRCTAKLLSRVKVQPDSVPATSTTRLGDWYATILVGRPAHLVLLVNEPTRLAALLPAREISTLTRRIPEAIAAVLLTLGVAASVIDDESAAMSEITYARTANRSVLGTMNDYVIMMEAGTGFQAEELLSVSMFLNRTPVSPLKYERPDDYARRVLGAVHLRVTPPN